MEEKIDLLNECVGQGENIQKITLGEWLKSLFAYEEEGSNHRKKDAPWWLCWLCALSIILMLNQIHLPILGGRVFISDIFFLISFVPMFAWIFARRRVLFFPMAGLGVLVLACIVNLFAHSGVPGAIECAQMIQCLLCSVLFFSFMLEFAPKLSCLAVLTALFLNVIIAIFHAAHYGIGSALAPADVLKLNWGIGGAFTGFFRSRSALSFFTSAALVWLFPQIIGSHNSRFRSFVAAIVAIPSLLLIVNGQMLAITILILILEGFIYSKRAGFTAICAIILALAISWSWTSHHNVVLNTLYPLKSGVYAGELKTNHIDFIAALKMAKHNPICGVGSGHYQSSIGTYYGELPNPAYNDIATDTQAYWGILPGTTGFAVALLLAALMLSLCGKGVHRYICQYGTNQLALGGSAAIGLIFLGMFISDPMTHGMSFLVALSLASVIIPQKDEIISSSTISPGTTIITAAILAVILLANAIFFRNAAVKESCSNDCNTKIEAPAEAASQKPVSIPMMISKFYRAINADSVKSMTLPFQGVAHAGTASNKVLKIEDNAGKPPEGKEPAMEYGGAEFAFEVPADGQYRIWLNVWWEGSCGNTINVQVDGEKRSVTAGNDSTYLAWHWVAVPRTYDLSAGQHSLLLLNREDGIMLDQIFITNDVNYAPSGLEN